MMNCLNCGNAVEGHAYCSVCGQRTALGRLGWRDVARDINQQLVEGNLPWITTLRRLVVDPGRVAWDYVEGRRAIYVHPLKFAFYGIVIATLIDMGLTEGLPFDPTIAGWRRFLLDSPPVFWLLMSPVPVVALRLAFFRHHFNTVEIWAFVLYMHGLLPMMYVILVVIEQLLVTADLYTGIARALFAIVMVGVAPLYLMWAVARFFRTRLDWSLLGGLAALTATGLIGGAAWRWLAGIS